MSNLQIIEKLEQMLHAALDIMDRQAELLAMHGIESDDGSMEAAEQKLIEDAKGWC